MHGENQCIGSSVLGPQEAGRTATTTGRALNPGPVERAARGRRAFRAAGAAAQEQRERAKGGHCLKAARGRQGTSADLQQDVLTPWTRHTAPHTSARRKYNDSDCCGGLGGCGKTSCAGFKVFSKIAPDSNEIGVSCAGFTVFFEIALDSNQKKRLRRIPILLRWITIFSSLGRARTGVGRRPGVSWGCGRRAVTWSISRSCVGPHRAPSLSEHVFIARRAIFGPSLGDFDWARPVWLNVRFSSILGRFSADSVLYLAWCANSSLPKSVVSRPGNPRNLRKKDR